MILDRLLADRRKAYTIGDLTEIVNEKLKDFSNSLGEPKCVTKRCIEKDLKYISEDGPFMAELEFYTVDGYFDKSGRPLRKRCVRYLEEGFSIFKEKLTAEEKAVLKTALSMLGSFEGLENFTWLSGLKKQLKTGADNPVILISKNIIENTNFIAQAFNAITARLVLKIHYRRFQSDSSEDIVLSPHLLKEYNRRWYVVGSEHIHRRVLNLALDRIESMEPMGGYKYIAEPADLRERYDDIIGVTFLEDEQLQEIVFWTDSLQANYIRTKPLHDSQTELRGATAKQLHEQHPQLEGGSFFRIKCRCNYELIREFVAQGEGVRVLSPAAIVDKVTSKITAIYNLYNNS